MISIIGTRAREDNNNDPSVLGLCSATVGSRTIAAKEGVRLDGLVSHTFKGHPLPHGMSTEEVLSSPDVLTLTHEQVITSRGSDHLLHSMYT